MKLSDLALFQHSAWQRGVSVAFGGFSAVVTVAMAVYIIINRAYAQSAENWLSIAALSFLGTLLAYYRPENIISWLLILVAMLRQTGFLSLIFQTLLAQDAEPTLGLLFWGNSWYALSGLTYTLLAFVFVLFPTGKLPSRRWWPAAALVGLQIASAAGLMAWLAVDRARVFAEAAAAGTAIELTQLVENGPLSLIVHVRPAPELNPLAFVLALIALLVVIVGLWSQIIRYRRGTHLERQQIKWVLFALVVWVSALTLIVLPTGIPLEVLAVVAPIIPLGIAIPILRYRLYDIDIIIRRTLVYGLLTAALAGLYYLSVVALQQVVRSVSGGQSPLAIVASTLMIAALFVPLRRRIQSFIDRRFYRRKYDAAQILTRFAATSRANMDLDSLRAEMLRVADQTMQPKSRWLWLK